MGLVCSSSSPVVDHLHDFANQHKKKHQTDDDLTPGTDVVFKVFVLGRVELVDGLHAGVRQYDQEDKVTDRLDTGMIGNSVKIQVFNSTVRII